MGNAASLVYTKGALVPTRQPAIRQLFEAQYANVPGEVSVFSYTTDASVSSVVPEITRSVIEKVQASRQIEGMIPILHSEVTSTGVDLVVPHIKPLEHLENGNEFLIGLFCIGRHLHLLHSIHRLSHNNLCLASIYLHYQTGSWLLTEDLAGDLKTTHFTFLARTTALLDPAYLAPEFNGTKPLPDPANYPIHARDTYAFAILVKNYLETYHAPCPNSTRTLLTEMTSQDYKARPALDRLLKDPLFTTNAVVQIVARLMDLRQGSLSAQAAETLFKELPIILPPLSSQKSIFRIVMDQIMKYSVFVHPAALSTKFLHNLLSVHLPKKSSSDTPAVTGILLAPDYQTILVPFLEECWRVERPGLATVLLKLIGRYIYKLDPKFVRDVVVKRVLGLNILLEPSLGPAYIAAYPIIMKHHLKKSYDIAPLTRHLVKQVPLFVGNDVLRTKALTCLLIHPKIPNLLLKEYLARGLTDQSPQVRLEVIKAIKKFAVIFGDNSGPMSAKCLADALMGSLMLSMVDVDASVRKSARDTIRKLTFVMERKENQIIQSLSSTPLSPSSNFLQSPSTFNGLSQKHSPNSPTTLNKPKGLKPSSSTYTSSIHLPHDSTGPQSTAESDKHKNTAQHPSPKPNNALEMEDEWNSVVPASEPVHHDVHHDSAAPNDSGWSKWDDWEDEDADFEEEPDFTATIKSSATASHPTIDASDSTPSKIVAHSSTSETVFDSTHEVNTENQGFVKSPSYHSQKLDMDPSEEFDAWGNDEDDVDFGTTNAPTTAQREASKVELFAVSATEKPSILPIGADSITTQSFSTMILQEDPQEENDWGLDDDFEETPSTDLPKASISPSASLASTSDPSFASMPLEIVSPHATEETKDGEFPTISEGDGAPIGNDQLNTMQEDIYATEPLIEHAGTESEVQEAIEMLEPLNPLDSPEISPTTPKDHYTPEFLVPQHSDVLAPHAHNTDQMAPDRAEAPPAQDPSTYTSKLSMENWDDDNDAWDNEGF